MTPEQLQQILDAISGVALYLTIVIVFCTLGVIFSRKD